MNRSKISGCVIIMFSMLLIISLISHEPYDWGYNRYPSSQEVMNLLGEVGAFISHTLFYWLGIVAYALVSLIAGCGIFLLGPWQVREPFVKILVLILFVLVLSTGASLTDPPPSEYSSQSLPSRGGIYGIYFSSFIKDYLGTLSGWILLLGLAIVLVMVFFEKSIIPGAEKEEESSKKHLNPNLKRENQPLPPLSLLDKPGNGQNQEKNIWVEECSKNLERVLKTKGINGVVVSIQNGASHTLLELDVDTNGINQLLPLSSEIAIGLKAQDARVIVPIPGKSTVGVEIPNIKKEEVYLYELMEHLPKNAGLPVFLGKKENHEPLSIDLYKTGAVLIAGVSEEEKSACLTSIILSILFTKTSKDIKLNLIDVGLKGFAPFKNLPHLSEQVVTDLKGALNSLEIHKKGLKDRLISNKSEKATGLVLIINELADLMEKDRKKMVEILKFLVQKGKEKGIYMVVGTSRPSADVILQELKRVFPVRLSFRLLSKMDSRMVLDKEGAERLIGSGDFLYCSLENLSPMRGQVTRVSSEELAKVLNYVCHGSQQLPKVKPSW